MRLAWGAHVSAEFRAKVINIARALSCDPSHLMAVMAFETGGTFNPAIKNAAGSGATGLIQFMPSTAIGMGTTVEELAAKTAEEQLDDVFRYYAHYAGRLDELSDVYMAVLYPMAIGVFDATVIFPPGSKAFLLNNGLDINHDGAVTKAEAASFVAKKLAEGLEMGHRFDMPDEAATQPAAPIEERGTPLPPQPEKPMGGLLGNLLMSIIGGFAQSKQVTAVIDKAGPASPAITALMQTILASVAAQAGTTPAAMQADPKAAVAAVAAVQSDTAKMAAVEDAAMAHLNAVAPMIDKMAQLDAALWKAQDEGRKTVSTIAIEEHRAGLWDMTQTLVYIGGGIFGALIVALLGALVYQSVAKGEIDQGLLGLSGPILMAGVTAWVAMISYRFDGTKESHATAEAQRATERYREETGKA